MVITTNDLLVLGMLMDRPMHGYELIQYIKAEGITFWFNINTATIYYVLNKLHKRGLISGTRSRGGGPERSVYHLTDQGREQFFTALETGLGSEEPTYYEYDLSIYLLNKLPHPRALTLLEKRLDFLRRYEASAQEALGEDQEGKTHPLRLAILERRATCAQTEREWMEGLIQQLCGEAGEMLESQHGLMILSGELRDFHFPDLIKLISSGNHDGTLTVSDGSSIRTLTFKEGQPVCATSTRVDAEVSDPDQIMNDIYDLFRWEEGSFTFDQQLGAQTGCLVLNLSTQNLILAGTRWVDNWATIQRLVPSAEAVFERRKSRVSAADLDLTSEEQTVLNSLDGIRDVAAIAQACQLTEFETSKILYGLAIVGLVQPGDLNKIRLRRLFREFAELMCKGTHPHRASPGDFSCEVEVNKRCPNLPVRLVAGRIEDHTDPSLPVGELAQVYRSFLQTQRGVIGEWFGDQVALQLTRQVLNQISPGLRETLEQHDFA
jgi:DNA-binding PadR family transcriptional regulator